MCPVCNGVLKIPPEQLRDRLQKTLGDTLILEQELGGGGMSRVFTAHEPALARRVVVKVLPPDMAAAVNIDRFRREIQTAAGLQHPHIVPLLSAGESDGLLYFTMPYVRGESLRERLTKSGPLPIPDVVRIIREVASAIAHAHENGIVHRDIKPANILMSGGFAVVTDFGVAKALTASAGDEIAGLTGTGVALGTPTYMAPEQALAEPTIDHRADIYALGVVAYEMLAGATPFSKPSAQAVLAAHVTEAPTPIATRRADVPPLLAALVMRCLEKNPENRPQSATDVIAELDTLATPLRGIEPAAPPSPLPTAKGNRAKWIVPAVIVAGVLAIAAVFATQSGRLSSGTSSATPAAIPAIAVLPFENLGRAEGKEFTDGMTEEVTNKLGSLRGLRVIGRQSAKSYAGTNKTPQQIGDELGVKYLLTGTVRWDRAPDGKDVVRVSPALLRTDDASQVWTDAYQTVMSGVFEIQSKVATDVANALNIRLLDPERTALANQPTTNVEAFGYWLRGNEVVRSSATGVAMREAVTWYEKAVASDPQFAEAWAMLALSHVEVFWFFADRTADRLKQAKAALDRAEAIDADIPEVHLARGAYYYHGFREYDNALAEFRKAEAKRPNNFDALIYTGAILRRTGKFEESIDAMRRAVELEPRIGANAGDLAATLMFLHRYREGEEFANQAILVSPKEADGYLHKAAAFAGRGHVDSALAVLQEAERNVSSRTSLNGTLIELAWIAIRDPRLRQILRDAPWSPDIDTRGGYLTSRARVFEILGDSIRARAIADSAVTALTAEIRRRPDEGFFYRNLGEAHAIRGDREAAFRAQAKAEEVLPPSMDAFRSPAVGMSRFFLHLVLGENDAAVAELEKIIDRPGGPSRAQTRVDDRLATLRGMPRFERLVGSR